MSASDTIFAIWDLSSLSNPAEARAQFEHILQNLPESDVSSLDNAQLTTQLARTYGLQGLYVDAHVALDEAEAVASKFRRQQSLPQVLQTQSQTAADTSNKEEQENRAAEALAILDARIALERGRVYNSAGHTGRSEAYFLSACRICAAASNNIQAAQADPDINAHTSTVEEVLSYLHVDALHMLATVSSSNASRAKYAKQGIDFASQSSYPRTKAWLGPLLNNLGWEALESGDIKTAIQTLQRAANFRKDALDSVKLNESQGDSPITKGTDDDNVNDDKEDREENRKRYMKAFTAWKIAVWSVGHAQMQGGLDDEAFSTLSGLLATGADGPSIRSDLAALCMKRSESHDAVGHATRALELGASGKQAEKLQEIINTRPT